MKHKIIAGIAILEGVILLLLFAAWQLSRAFDSGLCGGKIYSSAKSPDGKLVAYAFERDCGATTGFASFVIIRDATQKLDLSANLARDEIVFRADGDYHPRLVWKSGGRLQVSFAPGDAPLKKQIDFQVAKTGDQCVEYQGLQPPPFH